jgi:AAA family ATP:ADP antiporter
MPPRIRRWFDLKPGEGALVLLCALYVAFVTASFLLARPIRNALFLEEYGARSLVYVYVAVPIALSLFIPSYNALGERLGPRRLLVMGLHAAAAMVVGFWYAFRFQPFPGLPAAFYIWVNCFGAIAPVHAWALIGSLFDTRQAKRLFGLIGSGASAGAIGGGLMASTLVGPLGSANLLLVLAGLIMGAAATVGVIRRRAPSGAETVRASRPAPFRETLAKIAASRYLSLIAAMVFVVAMVTQWVGFQLSVVADERFGGDADSLTRFFGQFNVLLGAAALAMQLVLTGPALRRYGLAVTLLLLPLSLLSGSLLVLIVPAFLPVLVLNAFDQGLRFSVDKASYELLYLPLPVAARAPVKAAIDVLGTRTADAVGGVVLGLVTQGLLAGRGLDIELRGVAALCLIFTAAWIAIAGRLRREYVEAIRDSIQKHRIDTEQAALAATILDRSARKVVTTRLEAKEPGELLYALDLLEVDRSAASLPALHALLDHPSADVRRRVIGLLAVSDDRTVAPKVETLLRDEDLSVRTEALLYLSETLGIDPLEKVRELGDVAGFSIRAGMVAFLARPGAAQNLDAARAILTGMVLDTDADGARTRLEAARLIERLPDEFSVELATLLRDADPAVARQACHTAAALKKADLGAAVAARLGERDLQEAVAKTLCALGEPAIPVLRDLMLDEDGPIEARREIPSVLAKIGSVSAQEVLFEGLLHGDTLLRHRVVTALNQLRSLHPQLRFDPEAVEMLLLAEIMGHYRSYQVLGALGDMSEEQPVVVGLRRSMEKEIERIFRLLGLLASQDDLHSAYVGLQSTDTVVRSNALEFLEHVLRPQLRSLVVPLVDRQVTEKERIDLANRLVGAPVESVEQALGALLGSEDSWLKACAAYAVGNLQIDALHSELDRWANHADPLVRETVRAAQRRLGTRRAAEAEMREAAVEAYSSADDIGVG